jgi:hypothetical protein
MPPLNVPHRYLHTPLHQQQQLQSQSQQQQQQQYYLHSPSSPASLSSPSGWTSNFKNFLQTGHNETEDTFADDALHWCE